MSLFVNRGSRALAALLHSVGLTSVNRLAKAALMRATADSLTVEVDGLQIKGGVDSWTILNQLSQGTFEPFERDLFVGALRPGMVVLDVGANVGYYTLLAAREVQPEGVVYAFEPHPRTCRSLRDNLALNAFHNVRTFDVAVSDRSDERTLYMSERASHTGLHRSMDDAKPVALSVPTIAVDDLDLARVDLVKLDIEGEEPAALEGMRRTLARSPDAEVFLEFSPRALLAAGRDPAGFAHYLQERFREVEIVDELARRTTLLQLPLSGERVNLRCKYPVAIGGCRWA
jgi:FkbM family methyltransferase